MAEHDNEQQESPESKVLQERVNQWKQNILLAMKTLSEVCRNSGLPHEWEKDVHWDLMRENKYDSMIEELCMKYEGSFNTPPEVKIITGLASTIMLQTFMEKRQIEQSKSWRAKRVTSFFERHEEIISYVKLSVVATITSVCTLQVIDLISPSVTRFVKCLI